VDNLFVFILIFNFFKVPLQYQHKILFWGIIGALVLRGLFILVGVALIAKFHFIIYILGAFLVYTGIKMSFTKAITNCALSKTLLLCGLAKSYASLKRQ
jgi:tellurite resistance protein TerC